ncbi:MAG: isochorismatase family protein [Gammaproteobacteria bacterium]
MTNSIIQQLKFSDSKIGFGLRPALFISDMQNAYTDPNWSHGMDASAEINIINHLLNRFHNLNYPVFLSLIAFTENDLQQPNLWMQKIKCLADLRIASSYTQLDSRLSYHKAIDTITIKKYPSAFFATHFNDTLAAHKIDTLIITGCSTSGCVRATAIDSLQYGFRPIIVADAVGDRSPDSHEKALYELEAKYADVVNSTEVLRYLENLA